MKKEKLDLVIELLRKEKPEDAKTLFAEINPDETIHYLLVKGKLDQKFQQWGEAINAFSRVIELDPNNQEAKNNLQIIQNILNFWSPEMFNP